jgi:hypothetical protein
MIICCVVLGRGAFAAVPTFTVSGDPVALVQDSGRFTRFAREVAAQVDQMLKASPDDTSHKMLLGLRVHLAIYLDEDQRALEVAERIRESQTDPGERAHSGLTTRALVSSQRDPVRFERDFTRLLGALPRDASIRAALVRAREKIEQISEESLLAEIRTNVAPRLARGEPCTLEMADQLVRAGHRLRTILPLRPAMLRSYTAAIAAQDQGR